MARLLERLVNPTIPRRTWAPKCRRVIHLYMCGGLSHLDSFDYKPQLAKFHGQPLTSSEKPETFFGQVGLLRKNDWEFKQPRGKWPVGVGPVSASGWCR